MSMQPLTIQTFPGGKQARKSTVKVFGKAFLISM